jgi:hypothetical protein
VSNKRDDMWKRRQSWLRLSKHPEPERTDLWNIFRLIADQPRWAKNIDMAYKALSLDSTKPIDRTLLLGILSSICFPDTESLAAEALFPGYRLRKPRGRRNEWPPDRILLRRP